MNDELLSSLQITKATPRKSVPGTWVKGTIGDHHFEALVFPEPAIYPEYEIPGSNISKFWLADSAGTVVADFDRGWGKEPATQIAREIVDLLAAGLAEHVFG